MRKTRKLIPAFIMLLLSAVLMSTSSFAWFSMNRKVDVEGMQVQATASSSLVISDTFKAGSPVGSASSVTFNQTNDPLKPITYSTTALPIDPNSTLYTTKTETAANKYVQNTNPEDVSSTTGVADSNKTLYFEELTANDKHYVDYVVYFAAAGAALTTSQTIEAKVTFTDEQGAALAYEQLATTVAFTVLGVVSDAQVPGVDTTQGVAINAVNASNAASLTLSSLPLNTSGNAVAVLMRVYIDGALMNGNVAYVNSAAVDLGKVMINVAFELK